MTVIFYNVKRHRGTEGEEGWIKLWMDDVMYNKGAVTACDRQ